jgi:hypothetical protein
MRNGVVCKGDHAGGAGCPSSTAYPRSPLARIKESHLDTSYIVKIVEATAWPITSIVLVILLRAEIRSLIPLVKKLKAGPLEAEFERQVSELRSIVDTAPLLGPSPMTERLVIAEKLAEVNPRSAILEAWREIESTARRVLKERFPELTESQLRSTREVIRLLREKDLVSLEESSQLNEMRFLRNQAVHVESFQPNHEAAINFIQLASFFLSRIGAKPNAGGQESQ